MADASAAELARLVGQASDQQLAEGMASENRGAILDDIFRRMSEHVDPQRARGVDAVIHWKILDRPGGGYDHYEVVVSDGRCEVSQSPSREPRVTLKVRPVDFLRLVSGNESGPKLFMLGRLRIEGDLMLAAQLTSLFRIPRGA
jgi:putative sterol carrier protein